MQLKYLYIKRISTDNTFLVENLLGGAVGVNLKESEGS